jgi:MFS transporter, DHA1 family, multidrug resistance protein
MSEMPFFSRNSSCISTLLAFILLQLPIIYTKNFGTLLAFRFITGFIGSLILATGSTPIADMYAPQRQVYGIAVCGIAAVCDPALGPPHRRFRNRKQRMDMDYLGTNMALQRPASSS